MSSQIGWPGGRERRVRQRQAERLADDLRGGRGAEELAAAARRAAGAAAQVGRLLQRELAVREARADRLHLARVLALGRAAASRRPAPARRAGRAARPAPSSSRAGPCRRWPRRARPGAWAASGSAAGARSPRRCGRRGCRSCRSCPACGRRTGRSRSRRTGRPPSARQLLRGRLHEQPDLPVAGVIAERDRRAVGGADAALGAEHEELRAGRARADPSPCPRSASARRCRRSGCSSSISAVSGSRPCGPAPAVWISQTDGSDRTISSKPVTAVFPAIVLPILVLMTPCFGLLFHAWTRGSIDNSMTCDTPSLAP